MICLRGVTRDTFLWKGCNPPEHVELSCSASFQPHWTGSGRNFPSLSTAYVSQVRELSLLLTYLEIKPSEQEGDVRRKCPEWLEKVCGFDPSWRSKFVKSSFCSLNFSSPSILWEGAGREGDPPSGLQRWAVSLNMLMTRSTKQLPLKL